MKRTLIQEKRFDIVSQNVINYDDFYWKQGVIFISEEQTQLLLNHAVAEWMKGKYLVDCPTLKIYWKTIEII